jgi:hypothetical protein
VVCTGIATLFAAAVTVSAKPKSVTDPIQSFAVLAGSSVTLTDSLVSGDVGVDHGPLINTNSAITGTAHVGDSVAQQPYTDFLAAYVALGRMTCDQVISGNLAGQFLTPGVYCVDAASTTTGGTLTLVGSASDTWIFKIGTSGTGALTGTNLTVVMTSGETCNHNGSSGRSRTPLPVVMTRGEKCNHNVYWWTAQAATLTDSVFIGSILAGADITVTRGSLSGQVFAAGAVTLTGAKVSVCGVGSRSPKPKAKKANEGVGNGVDGNTPGHGHNGGNDDPGSSPGHPGASKKKGG